MTESMQGATYLCKDCGAVFIVGPNTLEYFDTYSCHRCKSENIEHRKDLRSQVMIDNTGAVIAPLPVQGMKAPALAAVRAAATPGEKGSA